MNLLVDVAANFRRGFDTDLRKETWDTNQFASDFDEVVAKLASAYELDDGIFSQNTQIQRFNAGTPVNRLKAFIDHTKFNRKVVENSVVANCKMGELEVSARKFYDGADHEGVFKGDVIANLANKAARLETLLSNGDQGIPEIYATAIGQARKELGIMRDAATLAYNWDSSWGRLSVDNAVNKALGRISKGRFKKVLIAAGFAVASCMTPTADVTPIPGAAGGDGNDPRVTEGAVTEIPVTATQKPIQIETPAPPTVLPPPGEISISVDRVVPDFLPSNQERVDLPEGAKSVEAGSFPAVEESMYDRSLVPVIASGNGVDQAPAYVYETKNGYVYAAPIEVISDAETGTALELDGIVGEDGIAHYVAQDDVSDVENWGIMKVACPDGKACLQAVSYNSGEEAGVTYWLIADPVTGEIESYMPVFYSDKPTVDEDGNFVVDGKLVGFKPVGDKWDELMTGARALSHVEGLMGTSYDTETGLFGFAVDGVEHEVTGEEIFYDREFGAYIVDEAGVFVWDEQGRTWFVAERLSGENIINGAEIYGIEDGQYVFVNGRLELVEGSATIESGTTVVTFQKTDGSGIEAEWVPGVDGGKWVVVLTPENTEVGKTTMVILDELGVTYGENGIVELKMDGDSVICVEKATSEIVCRDGALSLDFIQEALSRTEGLVGGPHQAPNPKGSRPNQPPGGSLIGTYAVNMAAQFRTEYRLKFGVDPWGETILNGRIEYILIGDDTWGVAAGSMQDGVAVFENFVFRPKADESQIKWYPILPVNKVDWIWKDEASK